MRLKKIIVISITFIVIFAIWFGFELRNGKEYVVFYENTQSDYNAKIIRNIKPNEKYILSFDMYAEFFSEENVENFFEIKLIERGEKGLDEITSQEYTFGNFSGIKELELYTTSDTSEIKIEFRTKSEETQKYWVVNNLKLNKKEVIKKYKHLPTKLIEKIKDTNIQYKTAKIRFDFICDGLNLISQNFLTGIGGGGWFQKYGEVQERDYIAIDPHNYYIQIWLEFGILGLISVIGITYIVISFKYKDEEQNATYKGIKFAILAVLLRSTLDWDMYILAIRLIIFLCLGILANVLEKYEIKRNTIISNMILLIITISTITLNLVPEIYDKSINIEKLEKEIVKLDEKSDKFKEYNQKIIDLSNNIIKHERTDSTIIIYESKKIEAYIKSGEEELDAMLQNYYEKMVTVKNKWLHNEEKITEKSNYITAILSMLEDKNNPRYNDWMKKIAQINIDEFQETKNQLTKIYNEKYKNIKEEEEYIIFVNNYNYAIRICETNK